MTSVLNVAIKEIQTKMSMLKKLKKVDPGPLINPAYRLKSICHYNCQVS